MKKLASTILLFMACFNSFAQSDSVIIYKSIDDMSDKVYFIPSIKMIVSNSDKTKGFSITPSINSDFKFSGITLKNVGIGSCNEKNELIILFEDSVKITVKSWNDFNCKATSYFEFDKEKQEKLKSKKILKIKFTNGRTFDSFSEKVNQQDYFIQLFNLIDLKKSVLYTKKE